MEIGFLEDQILNCYKGLYHGLDQQVTPHLVDGLGHALHMFDEMPVSLYGCLLVVKVYKHIE